MSHDSNWDIFKYRDAHESVEHWDLRRQFMERWKQNFSEERLVCLARVFANIELMGCRYPIEVMTEVAELSKEVSQAYKNSRKNKLKRTFVSASDAAEDRAKGIRREGGLVVSNPKSARINFVRQGHKDVTEEYNTSDNEKDDEKLDNDNEKDQNLNEDVDINETNAKNTENKSNLPLVDSKVNLNEYLNEMSSLICLDVRYFHERMFDTTFGKLVLLIRTWTTKFCNIFNSCQACNLPLTTTYEDGVFCLSINGRLVAKASGTSKAEARSIAEPMAWHRLLQESVSVIVKEQFIAQGDAHITVDEVSGKHRGDQFGKPIESSVAAKMMKLMGWKGGGLGAESQGIEEPIKPNLQMVNREGLGTDNNIGRLRRSAQQLMSRFMASDTLDVDLVFTSEFTKEERAALHQLARRAGLQSRSYGDKDRFLVVKKKLNLFNLAKAVIEKGGSTLKYQVYVPATLKNKGR